MATGQRWEDTHLSKAQGRAAGCRTPFLHSQTGLWNSQNFDEAEKPTTGACIDYGVHWDWFQDLDGQLHLCVLDNSDTIRLKSG